MRRLFDIIMYFWEKFANGTQALLFKLLTTLSFLMIAFYFGYIVYYSTVCYSISRVIAGCIALCVMIHLNKSL